MKHLYELSNIDFDCLRVKDPDLAFDCKNIADDLLKKINSQFRGQKDKAKLNYARKLYIDCLNGESKIENLGRLIINTSNINEYLTNTQKREVELFVHNTIFETDYKMENLINSNGEPNDYITQFFYNKDTQIENDISSEVTKYLIQKLNNYKNAIYDKGKKINSGSFGNIYLFKSNDAKQKFVRKAPRNSNSASYHFTHESNITEEVGIMGACKRAVRRNQKGYDLDIRLSAPQVYRKGNYIDMEFVEKGDLLKTHDSIDIYDFLKQTIKLEKDLHENGYIHRDIKPNNLLLGSDDKIRLADMDSVIKKEMFDYKKNFGSIVFVNADSYQYKDSNKDRIDIYSTAVSAIVYLIGSSKFNRIINEIRDELLTRDPLDIYGIDSCESNFENRMLVAIKCKLIELSKNVQDKHLGAVLANMLNNIYHSMKKVLEELDQNPTMQDKKNLKIALSYISDTKQTDTILEHLKNRQKICQELIKNKNSIFFIKRRILNNTLIKSNTQISEILTQNYTDLNEQKIEHIKKIAEKFMTNTFTTNNFIITKKAIDNQKNKNISVEKLLKKVILPLPISQKEK